MRNVSAGRVIAVWLAISTLLFALDGSWGRAIDWANANPSLAAWLQALLSVGAILVAVLINDLQHRNALRQAYVAEFRARARRTKIAAEIIRASAHLLSFTRGSFSDDVPTAVEFAKGTRHFPFDEIAESHRPIENALGSADDPRAVVHLLRGLYAVRTVQRHLKAFRDLHREMDQEQFSDLFTTLWQAERTAHEAHAELERLTTDLQNESA